MKQRWWRECWSYAKDAMTNFVDFFGSFCDGRKVQGWNGLTAKGVVCNFTLSWAQQEISWILDISCKLCTSISFAACVAIMVTGTRQLKHSRFDSLKGHSLLTRKIGLQLSLWPYARWMGAMIVVMIMLNTMINDGWWVWLLEYGVCGMGGDMGRLRLFEN